ncbi:MAG: phosphoenolpyruvate synthase [Candidatus Aenigmatarchaeota archaeon]
MNDPENKQFVLWLDEITKETSPKVGGKGAHLGEMVQIGLPVPPGFVVTTDAYERFMEHNNLQPRIQKILKETNIDDPQSLKKASEEIEKLIIDSEIPDDVAKTITNAYEELSYGIDMKAVSEVALDLIKAGREDVWVAVRSSATAEDLATASFAGQMVSLLNIKGKTSLLDAIKKCWASLFTPRVIFYRKEQKIEAIPSMGVIVQKMVNSEKSGVIFTVDPTTNDRSKIIIEASWGLGEAVVSGLVMPDEYVVDKETGKLLEKRIAKKTVIRVREHGKTVEKPMPAELSERQVLNENEIRELWELSVKTENHYDGQAQDIEWCKERGKMYFVQTRPVTTVEKTFVPAPEIKGKVLLEGLPASPGVAKGMVKVILELSDLPKMKKGDILVARMTNPDFVPYMRIASAIITDEGGRTAHAAIVSRELGIPCIVGTQKATKVLSDNQVITVDASHGKVYSGEIEIAAEKVEIPSELPETATSIKVNLAFSEAAEKTCKVADGVGLLRAEHMLTEAGKHPVYFAKTDPDGLVKTIYENVGKIARAFYPKPVWYRTLDARTDEFKEMEGGQEEPEEPNPMLGWHGIRRSIDEPVVFRCEIEAIRRLHSEGLTNICIMLPFICKVDELRQAKKLIKELGGENIKIGIMVETPAAAIQIEDFCKEGIAFASIGSNDLTQLMLGVDRGNAKISKLYSELDPAILNMIKHVIEICKKYKVESSICGEAGSDPKMAEELVKMGIDSISVEIDALATIKTLVARIEKQLLLEKVREKVWSRA